ncbi:MAG: FecR family protein [Chitinophagales bacterium]|nr:FecR family protein [Chitinophagales bacterium]
MSQEKFWVLLSKKLSAEADSEELKELENLIHNHPEWQYAIQNLEDLWKHSSQKDSLQGEDAFMLHLHRMTELNIPFGDEPAEIPAVPVTKVRKLKWYWAAAAIIAVAGLFVFGKSILTSHTDESLAYKEANEISTRPGSKSKIQLPDGSIVMLNSGSKLIYNKDYGIDNREVTLVGEGFFDVKKNKEKPFIIHTADINIKVLGTVFNVKAYPEDKKTETSLIRGSIEVTIKNRPNDKIILSPSEKLVVENGVITDAKLNSQREDVVTGSTVLNTVMAVNKLKYSPVDSSVAETLWIENKLVFRDESFEELAMRMQRWYDVSISIQDEQLAVKRLSGIFERETIEQALEALKISIPFRYEKVGNKIIIHQ